MVKRMSHPNDPDPNKIVSYYMMELTRSLSKGAVSSVSRWLAGFSSRSQRSLKTYAENVCKDASVVRTLLHRSPGIPLEDLYVPPRVVRVNVRHSGITNDERTVRPSEIEGAEVNGLLERNPRVAITATGGMGKSLFCKKLVLELVASARSLPVLVRFRSMRGEWVDYRRTHFEKEDPELLSRVAHETARALGLEIAERDWNEGLLSGGITLIFDGLDELSVADQVVAVELLMRLADRCKVARLVVTSRPTPRAALLKFDHFTIGPFDSDRAAELVSRLGIKPELCRQISALLRGSFFVEYWAALSNPLLILIFVVTFEVYGHPRKIRMSRYYEQVFDALWVQHDLTKDGFLERPRRTALGSDDFKLVLAVCAARACLRGEFEFSLSGLTALVSGALKALGYRGESADRYIEQLTEDVCLVVRDGQTYEFVHRTFQEYFAAVYFQRLGSDSAAAASELLLSRGGEMVLQFLAQMDRNLFERKVVLPVLDNWLGYQDETRCGSYEHYVAQTVVSVELIDSDRPRRTAVASVSGWVLAWLQILAGEYDELADRVAVSKPVASIELTDGILPKTGASADSVVSLREVWDQSADGWQAAVVAISEQIPLLSEKTFDRLCYFRKSLGTQASSQRLELIERLVFGSETPANLAPDSATK